MRKTGRVEWFHKKKGWGFIAPDEPLDSDVFVHYSQIDSDERFKMLDKDEKVSFDLVKTDNGYAAYRVKKVN